MIYQFILHELKGGDIQACVGYDADQARRHPPACARQAMSQYVHGNSTRD